MRGRQQLEARAAAEQYDLQLTVMNLILPCLGGATAIRQLCTQPRFATTPFLIITGHAALMRSATPMRVSSIRLLTKPLNLNQLLTTVAQLMYTV